MGDVLLKNDKIRVIIQKPRKNASVNSFGGNIIDADLVRPSGEKGQDNFGALFPLVNVEWSVNYRDFEVLSDGSNGSKQVLRAKGIIDAYDYLDFDFIKDVAAGIAGQQLTFANRFDDRGDPFQTYEDLKGVSPSVTTDYTLEPGKSVVKIETTFTNDGEKDAKLPMGVLIESSGNSSMLVPGLGFSPDLMAQIGGVTPAVVYAAEGDADVSYGLFLPAAQFKDAEKGELWKSTSITYSEVTAFLFGEEVLKLLPLGMGGTPEIHFTIPAQGSRTITSYLAVGGRSAGSVLEAGLAAVGAAARPITGSVVDASQKPVQDATIAIVSGSATLITYRTDAQGHFAGLLPTGGDAESQRFGKGKYKVVVERPGYQKNGTADAGSCAPAEIDVAVADTASVVCLLGETGTVTLASPVVDAGTGAPIAARVTIVGADPSPNKVGSAGRFRSTYHWNQPFGIVDVKYATAKGTFDLTGSSSFNLEPGTYLFVTSHGVEYTADERVIEVPAGGTATLDKIALKKVVATPGYISADFHIHSMRSPDSSLPQDERVLSASAEGLDVLQSSDHDYVTDYGPMAADLMSRGLIPAGSMAIAAGDEVTPNHYGHLHVFPILADPQDPEGGAVDWSASELDPLGPGPAFVPTLDELIKKLRAMSPNDVVVQINHIMDNPTGIPLACGWVTSAFYKEGFGVAALSSYADPVERRMPPRGEGSGTGFPIPYGSSGLDVDRLRCDGARRGAAPARQRDPLPLGDPDVVQPLEPRGARDRDGRLRQPPDHAGPRGAPAQLHREHGRSCRRDGKLS